jgi:hypothetical protein
MILLVAQLTHVRHFLSSVTRGGSHFWDRFQRGVFVQRSSLFLRRSLRAQIALHRGRTDRQLRRDLRNRLALIVQR